MHSGKSKTLEDAGIYTALQEPGRYDFLRERYLMLVLRTYFVGYIENDASTTHYRRLSLDNGLLGFI